MRSIFESLSRYFRLFHLFSSLDLDYRIFNLASPDEMAKNNPAETPFGISAGCMIQCIYTGNLQKLLNELCWREDFHLRGISVAIVLQVDGDERVAFVLQGAMVLEAVFHIVESQIVDAM